MKNPTRHDVLYFNIDVIKNEVIVLLSNYRYYRNIGKGQPLLLFILDIRTT